MRHRFCPRALGLEPRFFPSVAGLAAGVRIVHVGRVLAAPAAGTAEPEIGVIVHDPTYEPLYLGPPGPIQTPIGDSPAPAQ